MTNIQNTRRLIYVLTAFMLLMQSFAFWHDAEHSFHVPNENCAQLHAVGHTPGADISSTPLPLYFQQSLAAEPFVDIAQLSTLTLALQPIRAPPRYIS